MEWLVNNVPHILTFLGGLGVGGLALLTQRVSSSAQKQVSEVETRGPEWETFFDTVKGWTEKQLESRDKDIEGLTQKVDSLRSKVDSLQGKYRAALRYARAWRLLHPESVQDVDVPLEIAEDI